MHTKKNPTQDMLIYRETTQDLYVRNDPKAAPGYRGAWSAYIGAMSGAGVMPSGNGLQLPHIATTVRVRDDRGRSRTIRLPTPASTSGVM